MRSKPPWVFYNVGMLYYNGMPHIAFEVGPAMPKPPTEGEKKKPGRPAKLKKPVTHIVYMRSNDVDRFQKLVRASEMMANNSRHLTQKDDPWGAPIGRPHAEY